MSLEKKKARCERKGGTWSHRGGGNFCVYRPTIRKEVDSEVVEVEKLVKRPNPQRRMFVGIRRWWCNNVSHGSFIIEYNDNGKRIDSYCNAK